MFKYSDTLGTADNWTTGCPNNLLSFSTPRPITVRIDRVLPKASSVIRYLIRCRDNNMLVTTAFSNLTPTYKNCILWPVKRLYADKTAICCSYSGLVLTLSIHNNTHGLQHSITETKTRPENRPWKAYNNSYPIQWS